MNARTLLPDLRPPFLACGGLLVIAPLPYTFLLCPACWQISPPLSLLGKFSAYFTATTTTATEYLHLGLPVTSGSNNTPNTSYWLAPLNLLVPIFTQSINTIFDKAVELATSASSPTNTPIGRQEDRIQKVKMAALAPITTSARQPFGVLNESKIRSLQSVKNRQNGMPMTSSPPQTLYLAC